MKVAREGYTQIEEKECRRSYHIIEERRGMQENRSETLSVEC
jgi:hypothetical protein